MFNENLIKNPIQIESGTYYKNGNSFVIGTTMFTIRKRKNQLERKPPYYLVRLSPFQYISSLYQIGEQNYMMEYDGINYKLEIIENKIFISLLDAA